MPVQPLRLCELPPEMEEKVDAFLESLNLGANPDHKARFDELRANDPVLAEAVAEVLEAETVLPLTAEDGLVNPDVLKRMNADIERFETLPQEMIDEMTSIGTVKELFDTMVDAMHFICAVRQEKAHPLSHLLNEELASVPEEEQHKITITLTTLRAAMLKVPLWPEMQRKRQEEAERIVREALDEKARIAAQTAAVKNLGKKAPKVVFRKSKPQA